MRQIRKPDWNLPKGVHAFYTTRHNGVSLAPYDSFNLGLHVGDSPNAVWQNRQQLPLYEHIGWLNQIHGTEFVELSGSDHNQQSTATADASFSRACNTVCAVMTADCLPILVCDQQATIVAAIHAGWRGLASGIVQKTLLSLPCKTQNMSMWIGPHISQRFFEVDHTVKSHFSDFPEAFKTAHDSDKFYCDMASIVKQIAHAIGIGDVQGGHLCTYQRADLFFSHRRASHAGLPQTGRMVCGIYRDNK